jgi:hypothetical protein
MLHVTRYTCTCTLIFTPAAFFCTHGPRLAARTQHPAHLWAGGAGFGDKPAKKQHGVLPLAALQGVVAHWPLRAALGSGSASLAAVQRQPAAAKMPSQASPNRPARWPRDARPARPALAALWVRRLQYSSRVEGLYRGRVEGLYRGRVEWLYRGRVQAV